MPTSSDLELEGRSFASRDDYLQHLEEERRTLVRECRAYYAGTQYDADNEECARELTEDLLRGEKSVVRRLFDRFHLPEHLRRHAYSTQIPEAVDWIADRLAEGFDVTAEPKQADEVITRCLDATPELSGGDDEDEQRSVATVLREAGKVGDVPVLVRWDPAEATCWLEFWDTETVDVRFVDGRPDRVESVTVEQVDWRVVDGQMRQVTLRREWVMTDADEGNGSRQSAGRERRCVERVFVVSEGEKVAERPVAVHEWGTPLVPWWPVRAQRDSLRALRGAPLITQQAMRTADRYNAVEQVSWLIARYNSHGNLAVVGDTALVQGQDKPVHKDVADVLTFPGGTSVTAITLPTDAQMIEHQKETLTDALYGRFGLVRTDQQTVAGLGAVSGYALEILNEKGEGTFARVRAQLIKDLKALFTLVLDLHAAYSANAPDQAGAALGDDDAGSPLDNGGAGLGDDDAFGDRKITVRLGSGWVVDVASARDDYLAGAISRREYLRVTGRGKEEIDAIFNEIAEEASETSSRAQTGENSTFNSFTVGTAAGQPGGVTNNISTGRRTVGAGIAAG
jgi:hypothetical protein